MINLLLSGLRAARPVFFSRTLIPILIVACALAIPHSGFAAYQSSADSEQEERFNNAVQWFTQNRFTDARTLFEGVRGSHSEEARKYLEKMQAYKAAMEDADYMMRRSPDELDVANLDFAIGKYREAIAIKSEGPWNAKEKLEKAIAQRAKLQQLSGPATEARERNLCDKLQKASLAHAYDQAKYFACALSNDDPGYSCGGDEALRLCDQMKELALAGPRLPGNPSRAPAPPAAAIPNDGSQKSVLDKARAAFDANDFEKARVTFQRVTGEEKASAQEYLGKIAQYGIAMKQGAKLSQDAKYGEARAAYQDAAKIKPDGPGNPQEQAGLMSLQQGVSEFYDGNYSQASQSLEDYVQASTQKADIAYFYMGACELARFFLAGGQDANLHEQALVDFRKAKQAGFRPKNHDVSPKILKVYEEIAF